MTRCVIALNHSSLVSVIYSISDDFCKGQNALKKDKFENIRMTIYVVSS